ncbi:MULTISPECIES: hypothetical protein [Haematobacter]|uniref:Uncharacterized protein n=1 Tax=Haematobacter genomosp. 1 TaxID=366618 RepID=A0A212AC11_9RHOB|nr:MULTISPECIES: hypothetical protein [Haematobacter]OWJ78403.1 hypothetical protein CDV49_08170 [Haematobacter genomosp. 1]
MKSPSEQTEQKPVGRDEDRQENANLIRRVFRSPSQAEVARKAADFLGGEVTDRTVINWLQCRHDMPAWAFKRVSAYLEIVERIARRIEG